MNGAPPDYELNAAVVEEPDQAIPARERIADRFGTCTFAARLRLSGLEEALQVVDDLAAVLQGGTPTMGRVRLII